MRDQVDKVGSTSGSLVAGLQTREEKSWERFVELYGPIIYIWCRKCQVKPEDAADLSQEVFRRVFTGIENFRHKRSTDTFRGWLWTITRNVVRDAARAGKLSAEGKGGTGMQNFLHQIPQDEDSAHLSSEVPGIGLLVQRALETIREDFNEQTWQAFHLTAFEGYTSHTAAKELEVTPNAVRKAKARVLRRLREELGDVE